MPTLLLTDGDIELFRWVWMLQVLTLDQIRRLGYFQPETGLLSHPDNVRKRMGRLAKAGYLVGDDIWEEYTRKRQRVYRLGKEALAPLNYHFGIEQNRLHKPKAQNTFRQVYHSLLVSECAVRIVECLRGTPFETPDLLPLGMPFYLTHTVGNPHSKKHVERFVTQEDIPAAGQQNPYRIRPDLVFALGTEGVYRLFFLEADRGTESAAEIALKLRGYHHYHRFADSRQPGRYLWNRYGEVRDFRVLVVTTTANRIASLREKLEQEPGFELAAFTIAEKVKKADAVLDEDWTVVSGACRALLRK